MSVKRQAFTLVELLVVIGIIALLISILLPSLNSAKKAAVAVKCMSNLRSLGQAATQYAGDNKGFILPVNVNGLDKTNTVQTDWWPFLLIQGKYLPNPFVDAAAQGPVNSVFICPGVRNNVIFADPFTKSGAAVTAAGAFSVADGYCRYKSSVVMNDQYKPSPGAADNGAGGAAIVDVGYAINGATDKWARNPMVGEQNLPSQVVSYRGAATPRAPARRLSDFKRASQTIFMCDGFKSDLYSGQGFSNLWGITGIRHGRARLDSLSSTNNAKLLSSGTTNVLFLDGHVEGVPRNDLPISDPEQIRGDRTKAKDNKYLFNLAQ